MHQHQPVAPPTAMDSIPRRWVLKPLSPVLQPSDLRTIAGPPGRDEPDVAEAILTFDNVPVNGNHFSELVSLHHSDGSEDFKVQFRQILVSADRPSIGDEGPLSSASSPCSSSSGSHSGFYSFVEDPASPEAEQNQAWMVSPQREAQLLTLKEESGFKLRTYTSIRKPESLFSDGQEDSMYQDKSQNRVQVVGEEEEKQLRQEIIRSQAPKKNPVFKEELQILENLDLTRSPHKLSYSPVRLVRPDPLAPLDPGDIVKEQINFSAARKQFLQMEQDQLAALLDPRRSSKPPPNSSLLQESEVFTSQRVVIEKVQSMGEDEVEPDDQTEESLSGHSSVFGDLDSGPEENCGWETSNNETTPETPIEREIRQVQEREVDLRRSRGLKPNDNRVEMVEIKTTRLQPLAPIKTKEKTRVSFGVQREILQQKQDGAEPEQSGPWTLNDRNPAQQLPDKKSENEQEDGSGDLLSPCCPHRHPEDLRESITQPRSLWSPVTVTDAGPSHQVEKTFPTSSFSRFSLDSVTAQQDVTHNTPQRWRETLDSIGLQSRGRQGTPNFIEKEIEEALRREKELKDMRKSREKSHLSSPTVYRETKMAAGLFYSPTHPEKLLSNSSPTMFLLATPPQRQPRVKQPDTSYAGIKLIDDVNNKVIQSTRVFRHKNQRALRWEAGVFANMENQDPDL